MALYVDSAFLEDISHVATIVPLAGATTNPSILLAARERGQRLTTARVLQELLSLLPGDIFMQPGATDEEGMEREAIAYIQRAPERIIPKIPMTQTGMRVARRLKSQGQRISFTAVTSVAQAYSAALVPADFVIPYYNRLQRSGIDAGDRIAQIAELFHNQQLPARILAASIKSPDEASAALLAGAHDLTVAPDTLLSLVSDPLSEEAIARFSQDWQKMNKL